MNSVSETDKIIKVIQFSGPDYPPGDIVQKSHPLGSCRILGSHFLGAGSANPGYKAGSLGFVPKRVQRILNLSQIRNHCFGLKRNRPSNYSSAGTDAPQTGMKKPAG